MLTGTAGSRASRSSFIATPALPGLSTLGDVNGFTIVDNGVGFNQPNLESFFTPDAQYKVRKGGKGLGRFIWLKAFDRAEVERHYRENGRLLRSHTSSAISVPPFWLDGRRRNRQGGGSGGGSRRRLMRLSFRCANLDQWDDSWKT